MIIPHKAKLTCKASIFGLPTTPESHAPCNRGSTRFGTATLAATRGARGSSNIGSKRGQKEITSRNGVDSQSLLAETRLGRARGRRRLRV